MTYNEAEVMQNVPARLRGKVKGIGNFAPAQPMLPQPEEESSFFDFIPQVGTSVTTYGEAADALDGALDGIKESNAYKTYMYSDTEKLTEARKISTALNIPEKAILASDDNLNNARDMYNYREKQKSLMPDGKEAFDMAEVYRAYPVLKELAGMDESAAAIALHNIENVKQTHGIIEAAKTGWHLDDLQKERSALGYKGYAGELTEADRKRLTELDEEMKNAKTLPGLLDAPVESVVGNTAQQLPMMVRQFLNGKWMAIGGAALGAGVSALGAGTATGGAGTIPAAAYGARVGFSVGARLGFAKSMFEEVVGNYYLDYIGYKDRQGNQLLSDGDARLWATVSAVAETGIEMANFESVVGVLKGSPAGAGVAEIIENAVKNGAADASVKAQLKNWMKHNARNIGLVAATESAEEGVQNAVSMGVSTAAAHFNPGGNIPSYSMAEMAMGTVEGAWEALPASLGFGVMAAAGGNIKHVRKVMTAADGINEQLTYMRKNLAGIEMIDALAQNKAASKMAKENPEVYNAALKSELEGSGFENVYVDTELVLEQEGGMEILKQLATAAGVEGDAFNTVVETKADLVIPAADYVNAAADDILRDKLRGLISFAEGAECFARNRRIAQEMKRRMDKMVNADMERELQNVHNFAEANFAEGMERDMAEFMLGQYEDPLEGIKEYRAERQREIDAMLEPVIETMRQGMKQGVAMVKDEETGGYYRVSNNDPWYSKYYAENKKAPSERELKNLARDIVTGDNRYGVQGYDFNSIEAEEWAAENKAQLETIDKELETLDAIEAKLATLDRTELAATQSLSADGIKVYKEVYEKLRHAPGTAGKVANINAMFFAHRAERFAEAMQAAGRKDFTPQDYMKRFTFEFGGQVQQGRLYQAAGNAKAVGHSAFDLLNEDNKKAAQEAEKNVVVLKGDEFGEYKDLNELRKKAGEFYQNNIQGTTAHNELIGKIRFEKGLSDDDVLFSRKGLREMAHFSANNKKVLAVKYLPQLIENARGITQEAGKKSAHIDDYFYYLHSKVKLADEVDYVIVGIIENKYGELRYYNHNVYTEEKYYEQLKKIEGASSVNPNPNGSSAGGEVQNAPSSKNIIPQSADYFNQSAYHGTPYSFEEFDLGAIGTGEGAQAHGWGLYSAQDEEVARKYKAKLSGEDDRRINTFFGEFEMTNEGWYNTTEGGAVEDEAFATALDAIDNAGGNIEEAKADLQRKISDEEAYGESKDEEAIANYQNALELLDDDLSDAEVNAGFVYEVDVPENDVLLDEDKSIDEQPPKVREIIERELERIGGSASNGGQFYDEIVFEFERQGAENPQRAASEHLNELGIKGITYDGRQDGRCFVVFDDKAISIINRYNQSAGIHARTANRALLNEAQAMAAEGKLQREIYEKTGWRRGADGMWRFEIPDNLDKIDVEKLQSFDGDITLGEVYDNEQLYKAYPFLRNVTVRKEKLEGNVVGYANGTNLIVLDEYVDEFFTPSTLIHELQHIIQDYEGFASGGNPRQVRTLVNEAIRQKTEEARSLAPHATMYYNRRREYEAAMIMGDEARMKELEGPIKNLEQEIPNKARRDKIYKLFSEADSLLRKANNTSDKQLYRNLYGEREARAAEEKAQISTTRARAEADARPLGEILNEHLPKLPDELKPLAEEYVALYEMEEKDFDRIGEIEEVLTEDEAGADFVDYIDNALFSRGAVAEMDARLADAVFEPEKADAVVVFNDNLVASYKESTGVRGQTAIMYDGRRTVQLFESADASTFMHEMAHVFYEDLRELAALKDAPAQIKRDWETARHWAIYNERQIEEYRGTAAFKEFERRDREIKEALRSGYAERDGVRVPIEKLLYEWQQERFARGFEEYLRKGKAPTKGLQSIYNRFKNWLLKIYRSVKAVGATPSEEVRAVMDRLIATQEEIDAAMEARELEVFKKAGGLKYLDGTSAEMWERIYGEIHKNAYNKTLRIAMQDLSEEAAKRREEQTAQERTAAQERISREPVFIVWQYLQNNPNLDVEAAAQQIGGMSAEEYRAELARRGGSLNAAVDEYMADYKAELERSAPDREALKAQAEEAIDGGQYTKLLTAFELEALNQSLKEERQLMKKINKDSDDADEALKRLERGQARLDKLNKQIDDLKERKNEATKGSRALRDVAAGHVEQIRQYAERKMLTLPITEAANPALWKKQARQKARETEEAIAKGDWTAAQKAKKEQLVYDVMTDLATKNKKETDNFTSTLKNRANTMRRDKNVTANERYLYNHMLFIFGLAKRDAQMPPDYPDFMELLAGYDNNLELGFADAAGNITLPDWLINAATATLPRPKGYVDLTVDQYALLKDFMDNVYKVGREAKEAKSITDADGKKIDLQEAAEKIALEVIENKIRKEPADTTGAQKESYMDKAARIGNEFNLSLIKPETILQTMGSAAMDYIYQPLRNAANAEMQMAEELQKNLKGIMAAYRDAKTAKYMAAGMTAEAAAAESKKYFSGLRSKQDYQLGTSKLTKEQMLAVALNWGTDLNRRRVVDGFRTTYGAVERLLQDMDAADWQFVSNVWELFENYWPDLQRVEANVTGVTLEKQPAMPFQILGKDGGVYNLGGGYYPIKYDPNKNYAAGVHATEEAARAQTQGMSRLGMHIGNTKARVEGTVNQSIRTDLDVIDEALGDTIHQIAMRETVRDVARLLNNATLRESIQAHYGLDAMRMLNAWALDCWAAEARTRSSYEKISQWLRTRQTQAVLGFRVTTALLNVCNIGPMMDYIGPAAAVKSIRSFYANPQAQYGMVMAKSVFLRNRAETMDRDFGKLVKNSDSPITKGAFWLITKTDLMLACPLWLHEYQKAYQKGMDKKLAPAAIEAQAVRAGDTAVRRVFGSGQTVDLAAVQRGGEFEKMLTMFYSYFSVVHNAMAFKTLEARKAKLSGAASRQVYAGIATGILFWMVIPAAIEAALRAGVNGEDDEPEDILKQFGITFVSTTVGGIPVMRDAVPMLLKIAAGEPAYNMRNNPINETATQVINIGRAITSDSKDKLDVLRAALRLAAMVTGLPQIMTDGMITAMRWLDEGGATAEDVQHYLWALVFGQNAKKK